MVWVVEWIINLHSNRIGKPFRRGGRAFFVAYKNYFPQIAAEYAENPQISFNFSAVFLRILRKSAGKNPFKFSGKHL